MPDLTIYDSQGNAVADGVTASSERVKNFFFDGVRLSIDTTGRGVEVACFFRARESAASRSEQYYAVFESSRIRDIRKFGDAVEERVETDLGMSLDTSTDDTTVFEILLSGESTSLPLSQQDIDDIIEVLGTGHQPRIGVGTYRDSVAILRELVQQMSRDTRLAIAENADSTHLSEYDLVIEKGSYVGAEIFDETEDAIEEMKEQQRQMLQEDLYGPDDSFSSSSSSSGNNPVFLVGALVVLGVGLVVLTVVLCGTVSVPVLSDALCGGGMTLQVNDNETMWNEGGGLQIGGTLLNSSGDPVNERGTMTVNLSQHAGDDNSAGDPVVSYTEDVTVSDGNFTIVVPPANLSGVDRAEAYDLTLSYNGSSGSVSRTFEPNSTAGPAANDSTETATSTETLTETDSQAGNATQTQTDSASGDGPPPELTAFRIQGDSSQNVGVISNRSIEITVISNMSLDVIEIIIKGPNTVELTREDFNEDPVATDKYQATYPNQTAEGLKDDDYNATLKTIANTESGELNTNRSIGFTIDTTAPQISEWSVSSSNGDLNIEITTDEELDGLNVTINRNEKELLREDFNERSNNDGTYTYKTSVSEGGKNLVEINRVEDSYGNAKDPDKSTTQSV